MHRVESLGFISKEDGVKHQSNEVISVLGISPTICAGCGVKYWINILEIKEITNQQVERMIHGSKSNRSDG